MLFFRQRFCPASNLFLLCSLLLTAGFMVQLRILYNSHQKQLRLQEYKNRMDEISDTINSVERVANYTSALMNRLQLSMKYHKLKNAKMKSS